MLNRAKLFIPVMVILVLSGCWDNVEIDERAFITGIGFDKNVGKSEEANLDGDKNAEVSPEKRYIMSVTFPNVAVIARKEEGDPSYTYSTLCASPVDGKEHITTKNNKNFYISHTKVIIVGEELARDEKYMGEVLDVIERSVSFNRKLHFLIAKGSTAEEIITANPRKNMDMGLYIEELMEKEQISPRRPKTYFDRVIRNLLESHSVMVPIIQKNEEEINLEGGAILKNNVLVGWLNGIETRATNILLDRIDVADYTVKIDDKYMIIEQTSCKTDLKAYKNKDGKLVAEFKIRLEGVMLQHYFHIRDKPFDNEYISKLNQDLNKIITQELKSTFEKIQKEYKADIFDIAEYLRKYEPDLWDEAEKNWEEIYPEIKLDIKLNMNIRRVGIEG